MPAQNLHLTLYFIGNTQEQQLPSIKQHLEEVAQRHNPFILDFEQIEPGPDQKQPRLLWARFKKHPAFEALSQDLTETLTQEPVKKLKAIPHVTLARFRKDRQLPKELPATTSEAPLQLAVPGLALWQSELASPHPIYSVLNYFNLS
ncbi:hypothetical protein GCM10028895_20850 [Pontibacter rugosus]